MGKRVVELWVFFRVYVEIYGSSFEHFSTPPSPSPVSPDRFTMTNSFQAYSHVLASIRQAIAVSMTEYEQFRDIAAEWETMYPSTMKVAGWNSASSRRYMGDDPAVSLADADSAASYCLGVAGLLRAIVLPPTPTIDAGVSENMRREIRALGRPPDRWAIDIPPVSPEHSTAMTPRLYAFPSRDERSGNPPPTPGVVFDADQASQLGLIHTNPGVLNSNYVADPFADDLTTGRLRGDVRHLPMEQRQHVLNSFAPAPVFQTPVVLPPWATPTMLTVPGPHPMPVRTPAEVDELEGRTQAWCAAHGYKYNDPRPSGRTDDDDVMR